MRKLSKQDQSDISFHVRLIGIIMLLAMTFAWVSDLEAQQLEVTVTLDKTGSTWRYDLNVLNSSPAESVQSITIELTGANFDTESSVGFPAVPTLGGNNDGINASTVTWSKLLGEGELMTVTGDIDPTAGPSAAQVTIAFVSGITRTLPLVQNLDTWTAILSETVGPPGLIINGQATATLTWQVPTQNEDGTVLDVADIAGYVLYWGDTPGPGNCGSYPETLLDSCYGNALDLPDGAMVTTPLTLALNGDITLYFAMVAYVVETDGKRVWSAYSNEIKRLFVLRISTVTPAPPVLIDITMSVICTTNQARVTCEFSVE